MRRIVTVRGQEVKFSPREYDLLRLLVAHAGKVLTHNMILREVWGPNTDVQYLRIYIRALRQKIEPDTDKPEYILTETGRRLSPAGAGLMTIGEIIGRGQVDGRAARHRQGAVAAGTGGTGGRRARLDRRAIFDALQARENLGSTGLGKGFALPHARLDALSEPFALFVRLARPIDFAAIDGRRWIW